MTSNTQTLLVIALIGRCVLSAVPALAQDMEPKAYSASPVGANFLVTSYNVSSGSVIFDPTLPYTDVQANIQGLALGGGHTFGLWGKLALLTAGLPYSWGTVSGKVQEQSGEVTRSGLADARIKLSLNVRGNPAAIPREFAKTPRRTIVGVSLAVFAPAGQYSGTKLVNLGTNRWAMKPEIGLSRPKGRWDLDAYVGVTLFTANSDFYPGGATQTQRPMSAIQGHASYTMRPRLWVAADLTWYHGGSARVNGGDRLLGVNNTRLGTTISMPIGTWSSLKVSYSAGALSTRTGTDFRALAIAWQALWLSPRWARGPK
jgi:hypothetical protein